MTYLDHNATTAPWPAVIEAMAAALRDTWANPSSQHGPGQDARRVLAAARATVARVLACKPAEVLFTSGATESNQTAVRGLLAAAPEGARRVLFGSVEHAGHLRFARMLQTQGVPVDFLPVCPDGTLDMAAAARLIAPGTAVVSLMAANNETGVCMPIPEVATLARLAGARMHVDATQFIGKLPFSFEALAAFGVDAVSLSAHKFHGPKGVGALLLRQGVPFAPQVPGSQERGRRGGTENLPGIAGMAAALEALGDVAAEAARQAALRDALEEGLRQALPEVHVWSQGTYRLPGTSYLRVGELQAEVPLQRLSRLGVAASSGAACSSGGSEPSHVLTAMGVPAQQALAALRLSLGRGTRPGDIHRIVTQLPPLLAPLLREQARTA